MNWIEVKDNMIIGVHSHKGSSPFAWYKCYNIAEVGDLYLEGKIVKQQEVNSIRSRKKEAERHVQSHYSLQEQISILRKNDTESTQRLDLFLQAVESWLADPELDLEALTAIKP